MHFKRCLVCQGSGKIMGGGLMMLNCRECSGEGELLIKQMDENHNFRINKNSIQYRDALKKIKALDESISDEEAEKIFAEALNKIDSPEEEKAGNNEEVGIKLVNDEEKVAIESTEITDKKKGKR